MNRILIIEDDIEISKMLNDFLEQNSYETGTAMNGLDGIKQATSGGFDLILLDLMLPYKSGDELLRELRNVSNVPVIVMSAKSLTQTKIELLRLGADDYITKPFDMNELLARIEANIKRYIKTPTNRHEKLAYGEIVMNIDAKKVLAKDSSVPLTAKEYALLELMLSNPQKVFSKQNLYEAVWNEQYAYDDNTINTHISNLRKKLKDVLDQDYIETVWGMGYKMIKL